MPWRNQAPTNYTNKTFYSGKDATEDYPTFGNEICTKRRTRLQPSKEVKMFELRSKESKQSQSQSQKSHMSNSSNTLSNGNLGLRVFLDGQQRFPEGGERLADGVPKESLGFLQRGRRGYKIVRSVSSEKPRRFSGL